MYCNKAQNAMNYFWKMIALTLVLFGGSIIYRGIHPEKDLYRFHTVGDQYIQHNPAIDGKILFIYLSERHWDSIVPWLNYWSENKIFGSIFIVQYDGEQTGQWSQDLRKLGLKNVSILSFLDSSPYGFYPMAQSPALYVIETDCTVSGPVYRYDQV